MDDRPRARAGKRLLPALCLGTAHKIDEEDVKRRRLALGDYRQTLYADILAHWVVNHTAAATSDRPLPEYVDCDKMFQDLVARSAEHGNAEVPTQVLAAHVEPAAGGGPGMGNGCDEASGCDDGLGDGIASGRFNIGSAGDLRDGSANLPLLELVVRNASSAATAEASSVADINDADNAIVLEREGQDHTMTEASPGAKTSDASNNIMSEREREDHATAGMSLADSINNVVGAAMSEKAGEDNALTETSRTAKASNMRLYV
ncbi:hypothetical protein N657DRAFT_675548 [Parathielavia appendiculata]|uniref:Uncharacterized protein n=1 Tax=Parathielavia appendiculata TaxID=2587402 RepID=A0AAN6TPV8_9PEZI|nr:hypothetical protein N657DRAFT_675548 [Parathielavia appendiculata]